MHCPNCERDLVRDGDIFFTCGHCNIRYSKNYLKRQYAKEIETAAMTYENFLKNWKPDHLPN